MVRTGLAIFCLCLFLLSGCNSGNPVQETTGSAGTEPDLAQTTAMTDTETEVRMDPPIQAKGTAYLYGETEKDAISYRVGESVRFHIRLTDTADFGLTYRCAGLVWHAEADDGQLWSGTGSGDSGRLTLEFSMKAPGSIRVTVEACDRGGGKLEKVQPFVGGAICGFEQIRTGTECPKNFDAFWQAQLGALDAVPPEVLYIDPADAPDPNFRAYSIGIRSHDANAPVTGYLTVPKNAKAGSLKIRMFFYGYNASFSPSPQCTDGCITFAVNAHSMENGREKRYYADLQNGTLKHYGFEAEDYRDPSGCYFRNMILRDVQALRYLKTMKEWNGRDIQLYGGSMGGFQATAVAALEPGVTELSVFIVWMCDVSGRSIGRLAGWLPEYTENLNYFDSVFFAARVTCPTVISQAGLIDYTATPTGVAAYYNALRVKKRITFVQSADHGLAPVRRVTYSGSQEGGKR